MQTVLIDTDVAIDFLKGEPYARDFLIPFWDMNRAYLSVLSIYELYAGMKEKEREPFCKVTKSSPGMFATIQTKNYS